MSAPPRGRNRSTRTTTRPTPKDLAFAQRVLIEESQAIGETAKRLGPSFLDAVASIVACADADGTVLVTGLGKSGHVGAKISATLASLGIPSHLVHPTEAAHGDLGRFRRQDTVLAISFSGETDEVVALASILKQDGLTIISMTGAGEKPSSLERVATIALRLAVREEAGSPDFVAPTSSTTATLALGDALALTAARVRNFSSKDFARRHPGGSLGGLLRPVTDVMRWRAGENMPLVDQRLSVEAALREAAKVGRRPGAMVLVQRPGGKLAGIFTDGDLRRLVLSDANALREPIAQVMTRSPRTLPSTALVREAVRMFMEFRQDEIPIVDAQGKPVGMLDVQDLIAMRLIKE